MQKNRSTLSYLAVNEGENAEMKREKNKAQLCVAYRICSSFRVLPSVFNGCSEQRSDARVHLLAPHPSLLHSRGVVRIL